LAVGQRKIQAAEKRIMRTLLLINYLKLLTAVRYK
jgi:hypothetical protein